MPGSVLAVDDSAVVRAVLTRELQAAGWHVAEAGDGAEALERVAEHAPDVILLDIEMPRLNGFQTLAELRRDPELAEIPVIFLTGRDSGADVAEGLRRGAHDYLRKPFEATELLARLSVARRMKALQDELRARNRELERLATTDQLTGLPNRRSMQAQLEALVSRAARHGIPLNVLLLDVDHFKRVNDGHGHAVGDEVLARLADRLRTRLRREDVCGRWGGEEFLVLLGDTGPADAEVVAEDLRGAVAAGGGPVPVTVSIGLAGWDGDTPGALLQRADRALYAAKAAGRDCIRVAAPATSAAVT